MNDKGIAQLEQEQKPGSDVEKTHHFFYILARIFVCVVWDWQ